MQKPNATAISSEKSSRASSSLPMPIFLATSALPPVPNIMPSASDRPIIGMTMFIADRASVSTKRAIKIPSTVE